MTFGETKEKFKKLFENNMSKEEAKNLLITLYEKGEEPQEIAAAATVMREYSIKLDMDESLRDKLIDIVGTGGDKIGSFNISSTVSLLLASLGSFVAKHGNRSITSNSGSADLLEALGINLNLTPKNQVLMLEEVGFTFMFAQNHHPAMKYIMPIRKSLSHRTIFNILGPLTNPAGAKKYLLGVFDKDFIKPIVEGLKLLDAKSAMIVSSFEGMDEISISSDTYASDLEKEFIINPESFGLKKEPLDAIKGGNAKENAKITFEIFSNIQKGAKRDIVLLNSAGALIADGKARDFQDGIEMAKEAIESGRAKKHLKKIVEVSQKLG